MNAYAIPGIVRTPQIDSVDQIEELMALAESHYGLPSGILVKKSSAGYPIKKFNKVSLPTIKKAIIHLSRLTQYLSLEEISYALCVDHSTILHHQKDAANLIKNRDKYFLRHLDTMKFLLNELLESKKKA